MKRLHRDRCRFRNHARSEGEWEKEWSDGMMRWRMKESTRKGMRVHSTCVLRFALSTQRNPQNFTTPFVTSSLVLSTEPSFFNYYSKSNLWGYPACISGQTRVYRELNEVHRNLCSGFTSQISAGHTFFLCNGTMDYALRSHMRNIENIVEIRTEIVGNVGDGHAFIFVII